MSDWKKIVRSIAPTIGAALGGPVGGMAVKFLGDKLLGDENATEEDVASYISTASPDALIKLKTLENDFKVKMKELDINVFELEVEDKKSARELAQYNMYPHIGLTSIYIIGYFVILYAVLTQKISISDDSRELVSVLIGVMTAAIPQLLSFWFGSSLGSKEKTQKII